MDLQAFINLHENKYPDLTSKLKKFILSFSEENFFELSCLIRQIYLSDTDLSNCDFIKIPSYIGISREKWQSVGFEYTEFNDEKSVKPSKWIPKFLNNLQIEDITDQWNKLTLHRKNLEIKTDPFTKNVTGFDTYTSPVQREALARILFMPEGDTMVINLPTGSGKSLLFQLPVLMNGLRSGLTLVVVPTISLAIDQSRRMHELFKERNIKCDHDLAWYGGLDENKRNEIKENIRNGKQGILFTSPESVVGALLPSLFKAVSRGLLNFFCVDEAHLLVDWGDTFRPDYHLLTSIRNGLLQSCKDKQFKTLLFSATFTPSALSLIDVFFGPKNKVHLISGIFLRPEPLYFIGKMKSKEDQRDAIRELLHYVPKPLVIYTTEPSDAKKIYDEIINKKFTGVELFHGNTSGEKKKKIISAWASNEIDIVVGTSAFGVGVDKSNVRTVIHATVPETLDRFYQEVGRSGRDGKSSISIILDTEEDRITAENIANDKGKGSNISGYEKAYERWRKLISQATLTSFGDDQFYSFNVNAPRPGLKQETNFNKMHNLLTLNILSRSGLITLYKDPPKQDDEENFQDNDFSSDVFWEKYYGTILIKINQDVRDINHFKEEYEKSKDLIKNNRKSSLKTLLKFLDGELSIERALKTIFNSDRKGRELKVIEVCRGCPNECCCNLDYKSPEVTGDFKTIDFMNKWNEKWNENERKIILFPNSITNINNNKINKAVEIIINHYDVKQIILDENYIKDFDKLISPKSKNSVLFINTIQDLKKMDYNFNNIFFNIPTLTILCPWEKNQSIPENFVEKIKPFNIILAPDYLKAFGSYKPLKIKDPHLTDLDFFLQKETI